MKIRFFLLGTNKYTSSARLEEELKYVFSEHLSSDGDVQSFDDIKDATSDIAKAVEDTHALVFIADCESFGNTKLMLSKAFGFELKSDASVLSKALESFDKSADEEDYDFSVCHSFVPQNARIFVLDDGKYAGFTVASGNQTIILLPFDKNRTNILMTTQVIPYLNSSYHVSIDTSKYKEYNALHLKECLEEKDIKLAVAGTNTASFFKEYVSAAEELTDRITVSPMTEKRGSMQPIDYVVNLAITASELLSCKYGVAISNAFYTGESPESEKIIYLAVANERETAVREIHSFKGEDIPTFLARCSGDLCLFIGDVIAGDDEHEEDGKKREKAAAGRYKIAIAAVSAVIVILGVFCFSYFHAHDYTFSQWGNNFIEWIFPAGNPFEGIFDNFVPGNSEETTLTDKTEDTDSVQNEETSAEDDTVSETLSEDESNSDETSQTDGQLTEEN